MSLAKEHAAPKDLLSHGCYVISRSNPSTPLTLLCGFILSLFRPQQLLLRTCAGSSCPLFSSIVIYANGFEIKGISTERHFPLTLRFSAIPLARQISRQTDDRFDFPGHSIGIKGCGWSTLSRSTSECRRRRFGNFSCAVVFFTSLNMMCLLLQITLSCTQ